MLRQTSTVNNGVGNTTAIGGTKQVPDGGQKATDSSVAEVCCSSAMDMLSGAESRVNDTFNGHGMDPKLGARSLNATTSASKIVNIANLNKEKLLVMLQNYGNLMTAFASQTRNVHKKLKENLEKIAKGLVQCVKVKITNPKTPQAAKVLKNARIQTDSVRPTNEYG